MTAKVFLKPRKAKPLWWGAAWVYEGSIDRIRGGGRLTCGDLVEVCDHEGRRIGQGFWNPQSLIRVRMVTRGEESFDEAFLRRRMRRAFSLRRTLFPRGADTDAYRLVHAEGDGLPGLVADRVGDWIVVSFDDEGLVRWREVVLDELESVWKPRGIWRRVSRSARERGEGAELEGLLRGRAPESPVGCREEGVRFLVDPVAGQKTGFFSDQRLNRRVAESVAAGRDVLDAFSYVGGFGLRCLVRGNARQVTAVDSSAPALELAATAAAQGGVREKFIVEKANVLRYLDHAAKAQRTWGLVLLDPPKLVPRRGALRKGLKLYQEINRKGIAVVEPGGYLGTSSCSGLVDTATFKQTVQAAAFEVGRELQLLHVGGQSPDHPALAGQPESRYLDFLLYRVF
ncbi:MAG TPA: class I SAM-dependent rRNA methyltransferase [Planctomycetes bacterium]|nr:class I SAM-dependent rRNA methyltransferase [Planctomycetota bacterium]